MHDIIEPVSARLKLRQWQAEDRPDFARLNADIDVMKYFPGILDVIQSNALVDRLQALIDQQGWGLWAVEETCSHRFIGFVGLHKPKAEIPCTPCVEIGWRLAKQHWGKGYATEAARACLKVAFNQLHCSEIFSFTAIANIRSQALMQRLGMHDTGQNFQHPDVPEGNRLREHVLYKLPRNDWSQHVR